MLDVLVFTLILMFILVIGWHVALAILGSAFLLGASAWGMVVATIFGLCTAAMLLFILTGVGVIILGVFVAVWTIVAILLFPILFPILVPVFILFLFLSYFRRKQNQK